MIEYVKGWAIDERLLLHDGRNPEDCMMTTSPLPPQEVRQRALAQWDDEGGAIATLSQEVRHAVPDMTNAELVLLRVRVIALENLLIAVLAEGSDQQRQTALNMADAISPRAGYTRHPLTIRAAQHMSDLVGRATHFRSAPT